MELICSASSIEVQRRSFGITFLPNLSHSLPGVVSSFQ